MTPTEGVPYATAADLFAAHDWEHVADLARSGGGPRPLRAGLADPASPAGAAVAAALAAAAGQVDAACVVGRRYAPADLAALTGTGRAYLVRLVCHLALWHLAARRQPAAASPDNLPGVKGALEEIERLKLGERVFAFAEAGEAGLSRAVPAAGRAEPAVRRSPRLFGNHGRDH